MKTIRVNVNGYGVFSLFNEDSTKEELTQQRGLGGQFLEEIDISYAVGDVLKVRTPLRGTEETYTMSTIKIYDITDKEYLGEFI